MNQKCFVACHKDDSVWKRSSSGGAFTALTDAWFGQYDKLAVVYGCIWDENLNAVHMRGTTREDCRKMCGSKYIGSDMSGIYKLVEQDLSDGRYVFFSGTPCQIAALKSYLQVKKIEGKEHLLTVDFICHGVAGTHFFHDYVAYIEKKYHKKAISCNFRSKSRPERRQDITIGFGDGTSYTAPSTRYDWFYAVYFKDLLMRPSCYQCQFARPNRDADITIADHWDIKNLYEKAKSLVITNTPAGEEWASRGLASMEWWEMDIAKVNQPHMYAPAAFPENYEAFWSTYTEQGYLKAQKMIGNNTLSGKIKNLLVTVADRTNVMKWIKKLRSKF